MLPTMYTIFHSVACGKLMWKQFPEQFSSLSISTIGNHKKTHWSDRWFYFLILKFKTAKQKCLRESNDEIIYKRRSYDFAKCNNTYFFVCTCNIKRNPFYKRKTCVHNIDKLVSIMVVNSTILHSHSKNFNLVLFLIRKISRSEY